MTYKRRLGPKPTFWAAIVGLIVIVPVVERVVVDKLGGKVPGLALLDDYKTRRNG